MYHKKKSDKLTYGIIGLGRFGYALATELAHMGADFMVIDKDEEKIRDMRELTENAIVINSLEKNALMETGIQNCDIAIVCIAERMDTSILTTLNLVSLGIPTVIAKATSEAHGVILEKLGAEVVYPERDMAVRLASRLENSQVLDFIQLSEKINISKILVPDELVGRTVQEMNFRSRFGLNIIAIENNSKVLETIQPDYKFCNKDVLIVSGSRESLLQLSEWAEKH